MSLISLKIKANEKGKCIFRVPSHNCEKLVNHKFLFANCYISFVSIKQVLVDLVITRVSHKATMSMSDIF